MAYLAGLFSLAGAAVLLVMIWLNTSARSHGGHNLLPLAYPAAAALGAGIGLIRERKWGVIIFVAPVLLLTFVEVRDLVRDPSGWAFVGALSIAVCFQLPACLVAWTWPALRRGV